MKWPPSGMMLPRGCVDLNKNLLACLARTRSTGSGTGTRTAVRVDTCTCRGGELLVAESLSVREKIEKNEKIEDYLITWKDGEEKEDRRYHTTSEWSVRRQIMRPVRTTRFRGGTSSLFGEKKSKRGQKSSSLFSFLSSSSL